MTEAQTPMNHISLLKKCPQPSLQHVTLICFCGYCIRKQQRKLVQMVLQLCMHSKTS